MFKCKVIIFEDLFLGLGLVVKLDKDYDEYIYGFVVCNLFIGFVSSEELL